MVFDFNKQIIDIAITAPQQSESITVIGDQIEANAHPKLIKFLLLSEKALKPVFAYLCQRNWRDILDDLVEWEV